MVCVKVIQDKVGYRAEFIPDDRCVVLDREGDVILGGTGRSPYVVGEHYRLSVTHVEVDHHDDAA